MAGWPHSPNTRKVEGKQTEHTVLTQSMLNICRNIYDEHSTGLDFLSTLHSKYSSSRLGLRVHVSSGHFDNTELIHYSTPMSSGEGDKKDENLLQNCIEVPGFKNSGASNFLTWATK